MQPSTTLPRVTVVTVVLNQGDVIERTLRSVVEQDYPNLEYIVVDGLSVDGTLDIVRRYESRITQWVSGKDGGPYGGMNRGALLATGEWIIFMNGGDLFVERDVVTRVFANRDVSVTDVIYGDGIVCGEGYRALERTAAVATLADGNGFSHQASFVRTALQQQFGFDVSEKVAADYDLFLRLRKAGRVFVHVDVVICEFFLGGVSTLRRDETIRLRHRVYKKHFSRSELVLYYRLGVLAAKVGARALVPLSVWESLKRICNRGKISTLDQRSQGS